MVDIPKKIKILLVDDDEMVRIYFRDIFWIHGLDNKYEFNVAENIEKAEKIIGEPQNRPDLMFLDLTMPIEKDGRVSVSPEAGLKFLEKIKNDPSLKKIKVIVFSGHSEPALQYQAKQLGAENYLIKGNNLPMELITFVEKMVQ